jgi:hypothetical protein
MNSFMNYLKNADPAIYKRLAGYKPGTAYFNGAWKSIANTDAQRFNEIQHNFIKASHYDPAANSVRKSTGIDVNKHSAALQNVLWSVAVQHGAGGAAKIFKAAGIREGMSEADIIRRIYAERSAGNGSKYFSRSSSSIRKSVVRRFANELRDALAMLG